MKTFKTFVNESSVREQEKLEENYRTLAQKGIGAERKEDIKVGHGVDYYHPKTGDKHMGKIHSMSDKGYTVKDDKTGEKHSFDYFRKEEVELEGSDIDEGILDTVKGAVKSVAKSAVKHAGTAAKSAVKHAGTAAKSAAVGFVHGAIDAGTSHSRVLQHAGNRLHKAVKKKFGEEVEQEGSELDEAAKSKLMMGSKVSHPVHGKGTVVRHALGGGTTGTVVKFADGSKKTVNHKQLRIEETELEEEVPMAARALYAQTYAKHGKTASKSSEAKQKAYDAVEKKHGSKVLAQLKAHHEKNMNEESELEEADFSKTQTTMAHAIGKHFKKKGIGDESKGGPFAVASAMVRDKPEAAKKAYATIKAKMKNEDHQDMLMALYDELSEENQQAFEVMLDSDPERLLSFAQSHFAGE